MRLDGIGVTRLEDYKEASSWELTNLMLKGVYIALSLCYTYFCGNVKVSIGPLTQIHFLFHMQVLECEFGF